MAPESSEKSGRGRFGPYTLEGQLGRGGMGTVFRARDPDGQLVALKLLAGEPKDPHLSQRFRYEISCLQRLDHPNVVRVLDAWIEGRRPWVAMEYVNAPTLHEVTQLSVAKTGKGIPLGQALALFEGLANALAALKRAGILHRDVKPANVMVPEGRGAVLVDFGLAQVSRGAVEGIPSSEMVGTIDFIAPELLQGRGAGFESDLYSAGLSLWVALTGELPFAEQNSYLRACTRTERDLPSVRDFRPDLPQAVDQFLGKLLARVPERRLANPAELALEARLLARGLPPGSLSG